MVRSIHKINIIFTTTLLLIGALAFVQGGSSASADTNVDFNVDVPEALTVSISTPISWASGGMDVFLRNKVTVTALTNNKNGVTVSMYAADTKLQNTLPHSSTDGTMYIDTLISETTAGSFAADIANRWGYSKDDTTDGIIGAHYYPMTDSSNPVKLFESTLGSQGTQDVYFGAKANSEKQSGTYAQTVYFAAVTGTVNPSTNPSNPTNPSTPVQQDETPTYTGNTGNPATGPSAVGQTTYTRRTTSGTGTSSVTGTTETTTTQISKGDTRSSYVRAAGVTSTTPTTVTSDNVSTLGIALASAAGVAAVSGVVFLVAAKRRKDDE